MRSVGKFFLKRLEAIKAAHPIVGDVKGKGMAWIPAGHILRMSPPLIMDEKYAELGLAMIE